jgi:hypothetical protein
VHGMNAREARASARRVVAGRIMTANPEMIG